MTHVTLFTVTFSSERRLNNKLTATAVDHVENLLSASTGLMYALRVLRCHGIPPVSLHDVFRATVVSKITHRSPAWSGIVFSGGSCTSGLVFEPLQATWILRQRLSSLAMPTMHCLNE